MSKEWKAKEEFRFYSRLNLSELMGEKASNLEELLEHIKKAPDSCIYHHTHRSLQQHRFLSPEPPNDFAYWAREVLGEDELAENLASIDTIQYGSISALRDKIAQTIETYIKHVPTSKLRFSKEDENFYFIKSVSFILPTSHIASDLWEFRNILSKVTLDSIYFHIFEARLRLKKGTNDFSNWIENSIGDKTLAAKIAKLDPYTYTLENLRQTVIKIISKYLG